MLPVSANREWIVASGLGANHEYLASCDFTRNLFPALKLATIARFPRDVDVQRANYRSVPQLS
jgi:hypothetical protein